MNEFGQCERLDEQEAELVAQLRHRTILNRAPEHGLLQTILLERRELSLKFTEVYDRLLEGIRDSAAQEVIRKIIRDEYPGPDPAGGNLGLSHREDLVHDLERIGVSRSRVISYKPSKQTKAIVNATFEAVHKILRKADPQLQAIAFIRFWGEVLTAVEYDALWQAGLSRFFKNSTDSTFYWFHFVHDRANRGFSDIRAPGYIGAFTHSDHLTLRLVDLLDQQGCVEEVMEANRKAASLKTAFYTQFE
jgi:hypothetical protein